MRFLLLLLLVGCAHSPPPENEPPLGHESRPYYGRPGYLDHQSEEVVHDVQGGSVR